MKSSLKLFALTGLFIVFLIFFMGLKIGTIKEIFELLVLKRKFYMFPIVILLIIMIGFTALAQSGLVTLIYPI